MTDPHERPREDPEEEAEDTGWGVTSEAHDEIVPQDLPKGHPGRAEAEREAAEGDGGTRGNT